MEIISRPPIQVQFVSSVIAYLPTEDGGISLCNKAVREVSHGNETTYVLTDDNYINALKDKFGIELEADFTVSGALK